MKQTSGETSLRTALLLSGIALLLAVVSAPMLDKASKTYAENRAFGIDRVMTGSVQKGERKTVRKSIFWEGEKVVCDTAKGDTC